MSDEYTTITTPAYGEFKDRGSKFHAYAFRTFEEASIKNHLEEIKKLHPKARHHCYAYRLGLTGDDFRANDAGEPSGTGGRPILGQIDSFGLTNILIIVVRYFGGTKLGTSGLINAYRSAAKDALENAKTELRTLDDIYQLVFSYDIMPQIMNSLKDQKLEIVEQAFENTAKVSIAIRQSEVDSVLEMLKAIGSFDLKFIKTR